MAKLRSAPGMRERAPEVWELVLQAGRDPVTGKHRHVSRTFRGNLRDANKARAELIVEVSKARHSGSRATVDDLFADWIVELERKGRSPNTIDHWAEAVRAARVAAAPRRRLRIDDLERRAEFAKVTLVDDPYVFTDAADGSVPWKPDAVSKYFGRMHKRVDLDHLDFHHLRKFMETYGQEMGYNVTQVAMRAGHDPSIAAKHYSGRVAGTDRALAAAVASLLAAPTADVPGSDS